jgi:hypothetical protein
MKTYIEELLTTISGFHQTIFSFLTAHNLQQLFPELTAHSNFFHSHNPTKQTLKLVNMKIKQRRYNLGNVSGANQVYVQTSCKPTFSEFSFFYLLTYYEFELQFLYSCRVGNEVHLYFLRFFLIFVSWFARKLDLHIICCLQIKHMRYSNLRPLISC